MKWRRLTFAGLEEGKIVKEILLALGGLPRYAKKVSYLSNGLLFRKKMPDKTWRMARIWKSPERRDWVVEFWQVKPQRKLAETRMKNLGNLKRIVEVGMR